MLKNVFKKLLIKNLNMPLTDEQKKEIRYEISHTNLMRGRAYSAVLTVMEILLILFVDIPAFKKAPLQDMWIYQSYLILHLLLLITAVTGFFIINYLLKKELKELLHIKEIIPFVFPSLFLIFVACITGLDQVTTGQINAYIPSILIAGVLVLAKYPSNIVSLTIPHLFFVGGMFAFQKNPLLLASNVINGSILFIAVLIISSFIYENHYSHMVKNIYLVEVNQKLNHLASYDLLTNLPNRRYFEEHYNREISIIKRYNCEAALLIMDVDHFKRVNDLYGHYVGDMVLKELAKVLVENMREIDIICRWGGEEFLMLLPYISIDEAVTAANRIRKIIAEYAIIVDEDEIRITVSIGLKKMSAETENSLDEVYILADQALYRAKESGRNRVEVANET